MLAEAFVTLYEVTFDIHWLNLSQHLTAQIWNHFQDAEHNLFFYTSDLSEPLIARKHETSDNVIPASNSVLAHLLSELGIITGNTEYTDMAVRMAQNFRTEIIQHGPYYANWAMLVGKLTHPDFEIAILGENALAVSHEIQSHYLPTATFAGGLTENLPVLMNRLIEKQTVIYVCQEKVCNLPVSIVDEVLALIL